MSFRLRHRATFDPAAITATLCLRPSRTHPAPQWHWTYPQDFPIHPPPTTPSWVSAIRAVAVSDDAAHLAFISHGDGRVALLSLYPHPRTTPVRLPIADPSPAASAAFLTLGTPTQAPRALLAVGYNSGVVAIFDLATTPPSALSITRPAALPVRRLRFYPAFHLLPITDAGASLNSGLFAVLGWAGTLARLPASELEPLLAESAPIPAPDMRGAGWVVWPAANQQAVLDAVACADQPSPICELDRPAPSAALRVVTAGANPPLCAYALMSDPAFSARDVAKKAASTVFSAAKGFLFSRVAQQQLPVTEESRKAVNGVITFSTSWADHIGSAPALISLGDVTNTARKGVNAVLTRGRRGVDVEGVAASEGSNRWGVLRGMDTKLAVAIDDAADNVADAMFSRQRSRFSGEEVASAVKLPQNARVVERICAAPLPCSLLATADTLGRIFVQDSRDLCVLRVLKGYRDGHIAWLAQGGPWLVVYAARLNVLEVHRPLNVGRVAAFQVPVGSFLVQNSAHRVFCVSPEGGVWEVMRARKEEGGSTNDNARNASGSVGGRKVSERGGGAERKAIEANLARAAEVCPGSTPDYETVGAFIRAVKRGQTSAAVECLQKVEDNVLKVAHLMATLVTCTSYARTDVHVALASKAEQIARNAKSTDLASRFEAHGKLAEAFALLFAESLPVDAATDQRRLESYGRRLIEDDLGAGLVDLAVEEQTQTSAVSKGDGKRRRSSGSEDEAVNCERFILSHMLEPNADVRIQRDYVLCPRQDLSETERIWLAKVYFSRLFEVDSAEEPSEGREHPSTKDVFVALTDLIGLAEDGVAKQFAVFFLNMPLLLLLHTHVSLHASPLRCAIARLRSRYSGEAVDRVLVDECESSTRVANAVLLVRLCAVHESRGPAQTRDTLFFDSLDRLTEVLTYRRLVAGSAVPADVLENFTAKRCTGLPGDAERQAVTCLIDANDFEKASEILLGLEASGTRQSLEWHEFASVSEAALHACRRKASSLLTEENCRLIPKNVVTWIRAAEISSADKNWHERLSRSHEVVLRQLRAVLLSAHQYFSDSSVDAVRCLQLAEAMSAMIELEVNAAEATGEVAAIETEGGDTEANVEVVATGAQEVVDVEASPSAPDLPRSFRDFNNVDGVPMMSQESFDGNIAPVVGEECWDVDIGDVGLEEDLVDGDSVGGSDEFFDATSRRTTDSEEGGAGDEEKAGQQND